MKNKRLFSLFFIIMLLLISIGGISAQDTDDLTPNISETDEMTIENELDDVMNDNTYCDECNDDITESGLGDEGTDTDPEEPTEPQTWIVNADTENPNQVQNPSIQPAINNAKDGDTIILNGTFLHCHFEVNKTLNIIATPGTILSPCPHHQFPANSNMYGIFHIGEEGSGTVLDGITFLNMNYNLAMVQQNPYVAYIDGARDVELKNLIINWTGSPVEGSDNNPEDYIFNPILIKNSDNITLSNLYINNTLNAVRVENSNLTIRDSTIANTRNVEFLVNADTSQIIKENNNIFNETIETPIDPAGNGNDGNGTNNSTPPEPQTWIIKANKSNPNQILNPTVQPIINQANPGDTIILSGTFVHCHFVINKTLTIIARSGTSLTPCPHHNLPDDSNMHGIFYITSEASGTKIENFTFLNTNYDVANDQFNPFAVFVDGADDVILNNLTINWSAEKQGSGSYVNDPEDFIFDPILIRNANNVLISNIFTNHTVNGIRIENSSNIEIRNSNITGSNESGILIDDKSSDITVINNRIENNHMGLSMSSANNVYILNNWIVENGFAGVNVNSNISYLEVKGNLFLANGMHAIHYDYRTENLNLDEGASELTNIDNNIFSENGDMIVHHTIYVEDSLYGDYDYNPSDDTYTYVGTGNGQYRQDKGHNYLKHAFVIKDAVCGHSFITNKIPWDVNAPTNQGKYNYSLALVIKQVKRGVYTVSIEDSKGNIAKEFNDLDVIFYLNDHDSYAQANEDEIYKVVKLENGSATADFRDIFNLFKSTENSIHAVILGISDLISRSPNTLLNIEDAEIPTEQDNVTDDETNDETNNSNSSSNNNNPKPVSKKATKITASKLTTYPISGAYLKAKLTDSNGKILKNKKIKFVINGKTYTVKTNGSGIAKVKVSLTTKKTYSATIKFAGDSNYKSVSKKVSIVVKTGTNKSKIIAKNKKFKKNVKKAYSFKLTNKSGKAIKSAKVKVKVNGKTYTVKTNSKGIAKVSIKLPKVKTYKIIMKFLGNSKYKAASKTARITVKK